MNRIRLAREDEAPQLHALLQRAYASLLKHNIHFTITRASVEDVLAVIRRESTFVLETECGLTATITVRMPWLAAENDPARWPFIHWFAVDETAKAQGYGSQIIRYAEEDFLRDTLKSPAVYLATAIRHPWLTSLYEQRGYQPFHYRVNPLGVELVYMKKDLKLAVNSFTSSQPSPDLCVKRARSGGLA